MQTKLVICTIFLCGMLSYAAAQDTLRAYIDCAIKNNPALRATQLQSNALQQRIEPARTLPDPMLFGGIMNLPTNFNFNQDMMTMKQIGVEQSFSVEKKYALKSSVALQDFDASKYNVETQKLWLIRQVKQQYYDLYAQNKKIETAQISIQTLKNYINIANTRYSTGFGTQQDILKAQLELTKMQDELIKMQADRDNMITAFNTLLSRDVSDSVQIPKVINFQPVILAKDLLFKEAYANNPILLASKKMIERDSLDYLLAKTSKIPDFNGSLWYGQRQATDPEGNKAPDMVGLTFGITLPVYSKHKQDPLIAESDFNLQKSQYQFKSMSNEIKSQVNQSVIDLDKNAKLVSLYNNQLIPQAEQNLNSGLIGYQENKIDFLTLTDDFLSLYNYRLFSYQAIADYMKVIASLEMLTTKNITINR